MSGGHAAGDDGPVVPPPPSDEPVRAVDRPEHDPVLAALDEVVASALRMQTATEQVLARADVLRAARAEGRSWRDIASAQEGPLIVELLSAANRDFEVRGFHFRQAEGRALRDEGLTMQQIGELFGVSRQRIFTLLRRPPPRDDGGDAPET